MTAMIICRCTLSVSTNTYNITVTTYQLYGSKLNIENSVARAFPVHIVRFKIFVCNNCLCMHGDELVFSIKKISKIN